MKPQSVERIVKQLMSLPERERRQFLDDLLRTDPVLYAAVKTYILSLVL